SAVGGLVGTHASGLIDTASAKGSVYGGLRSKVGGLVGENKSRLVNSLTSSHVSGGSYAVLGGLAGVDRGEIRQSSSFGNIKSVAGNR
ncbi:MAG: hypothetical protein ACN6OP_24510, partial [Pseudomonadales bacterium]